ncbi:Transmembrane protein 17 [Chamberlinius hualienensis]
MQQAVNAFTETIFPGVHVFENEEKRKWNKDTLTYHFQMTSSLPLQMSLYFNVFYFPVWLAISIVMMTVKFPHLHSLYQVVLVAVLIVTSVIEIIRLYVGYLGNLSEMIPELAGFWIISLLLQLPIQAFLSFNEGTIILPMERVANTIMIGFVIFQLICGYFGIKKISNHLATKFHLETFSLDPLPQIPS